MPRRSTPPSCPAWCKPRRLDPVFAAIYDGRSCANCSQCTFGAKSVLPPPPPPYSAEATTLDAFSTPIYINSYNQLASLRHMVDTLTRFGYRRLTVLDNNSTWAPLLRYYDSLDGSAVSVHRLGRNAGHLALFKARLHKRHRHEWFALTDPDLDLSTLPAAFVADLQTAHAALALGTVRKIGLALRIDNLARCDPRALRVVEWEQQFWRGAYSKANPNATIPFAQFAYNARIDTTFALYPPNHTCHAAGWEHGQHSSRSPKAFTRAVRVAGPYAVSHVPWTRLGRGAASAEEEHYRETKRYSRAESVVRAEAKTAPIAAANPLAVHAVCLTGLERSFGEIGANVREGVYRLLGPSLDFFGVRPPSDSWSSIFSLLPPFVAVRTQAPCWSDAQRNWTLSWLHCLSNTAGRSGDCRLSFLQSLCDLRQCEEAIASHEASRGAPYATILRLRADLFWEAEFAPRPDWTAPATVTVPFQDSSGGVNDKLAIGERAAMARYLTRLRHVDPRAPPPPRGKTTEHFLSTALRADGVAVVRSERWTYCAYTYNSIVKGRSGRYGCIARTRCRVPCESFVVGAVATKPGHDLACLATARACGRPEAQTELLASGFAGRAAIGANGGGRHARCVDLGGATRQLAHGCPAGAPPTKPLVPLDANIMEGALERAGWRHLCGAACPWPAGVPSSRPPACVYRDANASRARADEARRAAIAPGRAPLGAAHASCLLMTNAKAFFAGDGNWPYV